MTGLEARDVTFSYRTGPKILDGWSATFPAGQMTSLSGPSGRGKSTVLYLLGLMLRPQAGEVLLAGKPHMRLKDYERSRARAHHFGFVFQDAVLDPTRTVLDNVIESAIYRGERRGPAELRARELMEEFGVTARAEARPGQVSGGQAQRIALCRALLGRPDVLLADEPTGNLDAVSAGVVTLALKNYARAGAIVVTVTHDARVVTASDVQMDL